MANNDARNILYYIFSPLQFFVAILGSGLFFESFLWDKKPPIKTKTHFFHREYFLKVMFDKHL